MTKSERKNKEIRTDIQYLNNQDFDIETIKQIHMLLNLESSILTYGDNPYNWMILETEEDYEVICLSDEKLSKKEIQRLKDLIPEITGVC